MNIMRIVKQTPLKLLAALLSVLPLATSGVADEPAPKSATVAYEKEVMAFFIDHHTMAIEMAEMCVAKAMHADLRDLCKEIIESQREEVRSLETWLVRWYDDEHEPEMTSDDMRVLEKLAALSGEAFEIEFMKEMIRHHASGVAKGKECVKKVYHDELRSLCHNVVGVQAKEIRVMQRWLCRWYDICGFKPALPQESAGARH